MKIITVKVKNKVIWLLDLGISISAPVMVRISLMSTAEIEVRSCGKVIRLAVESGGSVERPTELILIGDHPLMGECDNEGSSVVCMLNSPWGQQTDCH